jgi:hypothetical protein
MRTTSDIATRMDHTGLDPFTVEEVYTAESGQSPRTEDRDPTAEARRGSMTGGWDARRPIDFLASS